MPLQATIEGNLGNTPELKQTTTAKLYTTLSIAATPRRKNQNTGEWEDNGAPLWIRATLWEEQAQWAAQHLTKGTRLIAKGILQIDQWEDNDGTTRQTLTLTYPTVGMCPPRPTKQATTYTGGFETQPQNAGQGQGQGQGGFSQAQNGTKDDPWAQPAVNNGQNAFDTTPPF